MQTQINITEQLEAMIDQSSLLDVLTGLELICGEKSALIRNGLLSGSQLDARHWQTNSDVMGHAARCISTAV